MTELNARDFIQIKTDQFNYEHFLAGPQTFTVTKIGSKKDQGKQRLLVYMEGHEGTPFIPCLGMIKCLSSPDGWGERLSNWIGKRITLFGDSKVVYGGKELGGVRVSHISGIESDYVTKITERRGVRIDYLIKKLEDSAASTAAANYPADQFTTNLPAWRSAIAAGKLTAEQVIIKAEQKGLLNNEQKAAIREPITEEAQ